MLIADNRTLYGIRRKRMVQLQNRKVMLTQTMMMEVVLIAVVERIHHDGCPIELLFSLRHALRFYIVRHTCISCLYTHVTDLFFSFLCLQGIGRLFRCLCNPAFDVDDEEIVYKGK